MLKIKVKIIDTSNAYLKDEEEKINNALQDLLSGANNYHIFIRQIIYRQNSVVIEYEEYPHPEDSCEMCECDKIAISH